MKFKLKLKPSEYERVPFHVRIHRHLCKDEGTCYSTDKNRLGVKRSDESSLLPACLLKLIAKFQHKQQEVFVCFMDKKFRKLRG